MICSSSCSSLHDLIDDINCKHVFRQECGQRRRCQKDVDGLPLWSAAMALLSRWVFCMQEVRGQSLRTQQEQELTFWRERKRNKEDDILVYSLFAVSNRKSNTNNPQHRHHDSQLLWSGNYEQAGDRGRDGSSATILFVHEAPDLCMYTKISILSQSSTVATPGWLVR